MEKDAVKKSKNQMISVLGNFRKTAQKNVTLQWKKTRKKIKKPNDFSKKISEKQLKKT